MPEHMPGAYADLMVRCWDMDSTKRPTFSYALFPPRRLVPPPPTSARAGLQALKICMTTELATASAGRSWPTCKGCRR